MRRVVTFVGSAVAGCWQLEGVGSFSHAMRESEGPPLWLAVSRARAGASGEWSAWRSCGRSGWGARRSLDACGPGSCTAFTPPCTRSGIARCAPRATGWRRCSPAGPAPCSRTAAPPRTGACSGPTRRASTSPPPAAATAPRGSACTALVPSMPRTPPTMKASRSRRSAAPCSISPPRARPSELERALAQAERLQLYDHRAIHRRHRQSQRAPRNPRPRPAPTSRKPRVDPERMGSRVPGPHPQGRPPRTPDQRRLPRPRPRPVRTRLPLARSTASSSRPTASRPTAPEQAFRNDRAKDAALTAAGYRVLRFTRDDDPALALERATRRARIDAAAPRASPGSSCPPRTVTVFARTLSRTVTVPRTTRVRVPAQLSLTSHFVPRTVAELYLPDVRNEPLPSPQRWRCFFLSPRRCGRAAAARGQRLGQRQVRHRA